MNDELDSELISTYPINHRPTNVHLQFSDGATIVIPEQTCQTTVENSLVWSFAHRWR